MKKLVVLAVTAMFAFAVSAQTTTPNADGTMSSENKDAKMEKKEVSTSKKVLTPEQKKAEVAKRDAANAKIKSENMKKIAPPAKKDAAKAEEKK